MLIHAIYFLLAKILSSIYGADGLNLIFRFAPSRVIVSVINYYGGSVHESVRINSPLIFHNMKNEKRKYFTNLTIGKNVYVGRSAFLDLQSSIDIQENACISHGVKIITHTDPGNSSVGYYGVLVKSSKGVTVCYGAYIGADVMVLQGSRIGVNSAIAAGSLICKNVENNTFVKGRPARTFKEY